jgi:hypothetical protein
MAGPLGVLPAGPAVVTTEVEEDIDGSPPGRGVLPAGAAGGSGSGHHQSLKKTLMAGPMGGAVSRSDNGHQRN